MKKHFFLSYLLLMALFVANAQIGIGTFTPSVSAQLELSSTTRGFLPPRMTYSQKASLARLAEGLIVWCNNCGPVGELQIYNGSAWTNLIGTAAAGLPDAPIIGTATTILTTDTVMVSFTQPASNGGSTITSYTATSSPGGITGTLNQAGSGTITVAGLNFDTTYTFTVTANNGTGTSTASAASNAVTPRLYYIGEAFGGGKIAYIDGTFKHGLIASNADIGIQNNWNYGGVYSVVGATGTWIGSGLSNTNTIISHQGNAGLYAANRCRNYTGGGFSDWYLPSKDELHQLYLNKVAIGGFGNNTYWSSTEFGLYTAYYEAFANGYQQSYDKGGVCACVFYVRAVRSF